jgi:transcriptional regulator GlxA family with amidase domain
MKVAVLLIENFESFSPQGPVATFKKLKDDFQVEFYSSAGDPVKDDHGNSFETRSLEGIKGGTDILFISGGAGIRKEVDNDMLVEQLRLISELSKYVLAVGTGSALLAKTGLLATRGATTDIEAYEWVSEISSQIRWNRRAMWIVDDKYYTSSGEIAAGDMLKAFLIDVHCQKFLKKIDF